MKINMLNFGIAIGISILLTYGLWSLDANTLKGLIATGSFIFFSSTLGVLFGVTFVHSRVAVNVKMVCALFFIIGLILNIAFAMMSLSQTSYILVAGISFLSFVLIARSIFVAEQ
ncbi:MAG: hypothetical protein Q7U12_00600 [Undibacterium sp.]|nr:hypothetical protein [Undibacterium sp.]